MCAFVELADPTLNVFRRGRINLAFAIISDDGRSRFQELCKISHDRSLFERAPYWLWADFTSHNSFFRDRAAVTIFDEPHDSGQISGQHRGKRGRHKCPHAFAARFRRDETALSTYTKRERAGAATSHATRGLKMIRPASPVC